MYNLAKIEELSGGDEDFVLSVVTLFTEEVPEDMGKIEEGIAEENFEKVYQHAHKIKPNVDLVGLDEAFQLILEIEHSAKQKKLEEVKVKYRVIKENIETAIEVLKRDFSI